MSSTKSMHTACALSLRNSGVHEDWETLGVLMSMARAATRESAESVAAKTRTSQSTVHRMEAGEKQPLAVIVAALAEHYWAQGVVFQSDVTGVSVHIGGLVIP